MEESLKQIEEIRQIHIGYAQMGDVLYSVRTSEYVAEDMVIFVKQNEHRVWVISRNPLTQAQFMSALSQYLEKEYGNLQTSQSVPSKT